MSLHVGIVSSGAIELGTVARSLTVGDRVNNERGMDTAVRLSGLSILTMFIGLEEVNCDNEQVVVERGKWGLLLATKLLNNSTAEEGVRRLGLESTQVKITVMHQTAPEPYNDNSRGLQSYDGPIKMMYGMVGTAVGHMTRICTDELQEDKAKVDYDFSSGGRVLEYIMELACCMNGNLGSAIAFILNHTSLPIHSSFIDFDHRKLHLINTYNAGVRCNHPPRLWWEQDSERVVWGNEQASVLNVCNRAVHSVGLSQQIVVDY